MKAESLLGRPARPRRRPRRDQRAQRAALRDYRVRAHAGALQVGVEKRLMSDVPFGVLLSGGIDRRRTSR
jgi:asparagine synthetase B (glutamine-hydrolysing)